MPKKDVPKPKPEHEQEDVLSFDELKDKLTDVQEEDADPEVASLLTSLRDVVPDSGEETQASAEAPDAPADTPEQDYKSIYDDVLRSVMGKSETGEKTSRKSKFLSDPSQFVDITEHYQEYADLNDRGEPEVLPVVQPETVDAEADEDAPQPQYRTFNEIFKDFFRKIFPNKHDTVGEGVRKAIMDLSVVALVACLVYFGVFAIQSQQAKKQQEGIKGQLIDDTGSTAEDDMWAEFLSQYPNIQIPDGMMAKYAYLYALNQELVGWLKIPNSIIDVQIVQTGDNAAYLKKDFYGNYSRYGCPYMDYRNDPKYLNKNTILYGHHMSDGLIFADLTKYKTVEGFQESPLIQFETLYRSYTFKVYAAFITNSKESDDGDYVFNYTVTDFGSDEKFLSYMAAVDERKLYSTGVDVQADDKIITLQTCTYEFSDARLVIIGRMLRDGESTAVDTANAVVNENPRYPQAWYDKRGQQNPYADVQKWTVQ